MGFKKHSATDFKLSTLVCISLRHPVKVDHNFAFFVSGDNCRVTDVRSESLNLRQVLPVTEIKGKSQLSISRNFKFCHVICGCILEVSLAFLRVKLWRGNDISILVTDFFHVAVGFDNASRVDRAALQHEPKSIAFREIIEITGIEAWNTVDVVVTVWLFSAPLIQCGLRHVSVAFCECVFLAQSTSET